MEWWYKDYRNLLLWPLWMQPFWRLVKYRFVRPFHQAHFGLFTACFQALETEVTASAASQLPLSTQAQRNECNIMQRKVLGISVRRWPRSSRMAFFGMLLELHELHKMHKPNPFAAKLPLHLSQDLSHLVSLAQLPWDESAFLRLASANDWANQRTRHREERRVHRLLRLTIRKVLMASSTWRVLCGSLIYNQVRQVTVEVCLKFAWKSIACIDLTKAAYFQRRWPIRGKDHAARIL